MAGERRGEEMRCRKGRLAGASAWLCHDFIFLCLLICLRIIGKSSVFSLFERMNGWMRGQFSFLFNENPRAESSLGGAVVVTESHGRRGTPIDRADEDVSNDNGVVFTFRDNYHNAAVNTVQYRRFDIRRRRANKTTRHFFTLPFERPKTRTHSHPLRVHTILNAVLTR